MIRTTLVLYSIIVLVARRDSFRLSRVRFVNSPCRQNSKIIRII